MKKIAEKVIQKEILDYLKAQGYYVIKVVVGNVSGIPDILFCKDGKFCAVEVKATGKKKNVSELQKLHIEMIHSSGGKAIVADCLWDVQEEF
jgi:Holliday junction resolvase